MLLVQPTLGLPADVSDRSRDRPLPGSQDPVTPPLAERPEVGARLAAPREPRSAFDLVEHKQEARSPALLEHSQEAP